MSLTSLSELEAEPPAPLYPKLRPHPHGPPREVIERNQRKRLKGAMIEAVAQHGYRATSVAELTRLAGVSKRTFYEQYPNKEACFLATYDWVVACATSCLSAARRAEPSWGDGVQQAVAALAYAIAQRPKAAWIVVIGAHGAGPPATARTEAAREAFARGVAYGLEDASHGMSLPPIVARGMVYGLERVVRRRLLSGTEQELPGLADELAGWMRSYASPAVAELPAAAAVCVDSPGSGTSIVRPHTDGERARMLRAAAELLARGATELTPAQIAERAGVSAGAFKNRYESVEECLLDVLDLVGVEALIPAARAVRSSPDPYTGVVSGLTTLMAQMARDPVLRRVIVLHASRTGSAAALCGDRMLDSFADLFVKQLPLASRPSGIVLEATVGAVWGIMHYHLQRTLDHRLPEIAGYAAYLALAPVTGSKCAIEVILGQRPACALVDAVETAA
jgi:AcrR family transcriptional regulator